MALIWHCHPLLLLLLDSHQIQHCLAELTHIWTFPSSPLEVHQWADIQINETKTLISLMNVMDEPPCRKIGLRIEQKSFCFIRMKMSFQYQIFRLLKYYFRSINRMCMKNILYRFLNHNAIPCFWALGCRRDYKICHALIHFDVVIDNR